MLITASTLFTFGLLVTRAANPPTVGDTAPNFILNTLDDRPIELKRLTAKGPVLLVVLRGWPGYQCPLCTRQVSDLVGHASEFKARGAQVLMVYPGPAAGLKAHAQEFLNDKNWPTNFLFVTDPDFTFTKAYALRWDANGETAYPSTFVVDKENKVGFAHVSRQHGDRVDSAAALKALHENK